MSGSFVPAFSAQSSTGTKTSFPNPQIGHVQSSGISSNAVPGAIPPSGSVSYTHLPNFDEEVYANIDWPSIQIRIILTETNKKEAKATFSITPQKANTVSDALSTIHFINGLSNGTIKINGKTLINPLVSQNKLDAEQLKNARCV